MLLNSRVTAKQEKFRFYRLIYITRLHFTVILSGKSYFFGT